METNYRVIPRTPKSEVRIQMTEYKGRDYINVRLYRDMVNKETGNREWFPTKKGIAIPLEQLTDYITVLQALAYEADPPDELPKENPEEEARAQAEAEARPIQKGCLACRRQCKQTAQVVDCPRYEPLQKLEKRKTQQKKRNRKAASY